MTINFTQELITIEQAKKWLAKTHNRPKSITLVNKLCEAWAAGEWVENGETIKFNTRGILIDGQHRLFMQIAIGQSMLWNIIKGLPDKAYDTIDQGKKRNLSDSFARNGEKYYTELSTAVAYHAKLSGQHPRGSMTNVKGAEILKRTPGLRKAVKYIVSEDGCDIKKGGLISPGISAALYFNMRKKDIKLAEKFWKQIGTGEKINRGDVTLKLRNTLIRNKGALHKISRPATMALIIKAWNCKRNGNNFVSKVTEKDIGVKIK